MYVLVRPYSYSDTVINNRVLVLDLEDLIMEYIDFADLIKFSERTGNYLSLNKRMIYGLLLYDNGSVADWYYYTHSGLYTAFTVEGCKSSNIAKVSSKRWSINFNSNKVKINCNLISRYLLSVNNVKIEVGGVTSDLISRTRFKLHYLFRWHDLIIFRYCLFHGKKFTFSVALDKNSNVISVWTDSGNILYGDTVVAVKVDTLNLW